MRDIQKHGIDAKEDGSLKRLQTTGKKKPVTATVEHPAGFSLTFPETWGRYVSGEDDSIRKLADNAWIFFEKSGKWRAHIIAGVIAFPHAATLDDAQQLHAKFTKQPSTDFALQNASFVREFSMVASDQISIGGMSALSHTYTYVSGGIRWQAKDIRIPYGSTVIVLSYANAADAFDRGLPIFDQALASFRLGQPAPSSFRPKKPAARASGSSVSSTSSAPFAQKPAQRKR